MLPVSYPITFYQGATFRRTIRRLDKDKQPIPSPGAKSRMQVRYDARDTLVLLEASDDNGLLTTDPDGSIVMDIPAATTKTLSFQDAVYDLKMDLPDGTTIPILRGPATVDLSPTREAEN